MLKAPFPYFGGKSKVAALVWDRLGNVQNYVEPFFGSGAVLLARPHAPHVETVNDLDGLLCNFWRAVKHAPDEVAEWADWPVSEADLHPRNYYLKFRREELTERLMGDPDFYDARAAGWWVWGVGAAVGDSWCAGSGPWVCEDGRLVRGDPGAGVVKASAALAHVGSGIHQGIKRSLPHLSFVGVGIHQGTDIGRTEYIHSLMRALAARLRDVRICCGSWERVCASRSALTGHDGITGVFLDPPYARSGSRDRVYDKSLETDVTAGVQRWCEEWQDDPLLRACVCGYEGDFDLPKWECVEWKTRGGYGNQGEKRGRDNASRERLWFSPHCQRARQGDLFGVVR